MYVILDLAPSGPTLIARFVQDTRCSRRYVVAGAMIPTTSLTLSLPSFQEDQEYAVAFLVLSSVGGSVVGPVIGGFLSGVFI